MTMYDMRDDSPDGRAVGTDPGTLSGGTHSRGPARRKADTGAQWHMLPQSYPNYKTVHRRFQQWCREEVLRNVLTDLANTLREQGQIDEEECFIDAMFLSRKC